MDLTSEKEQFKLHYQAGIDALERGQYALSIKNLEQAKELVALRSKIGGEVNLWLVSAYQAAQKTDQAIALSEELLNHPHHSIREKTQSLLYIIKAPRLNRPREWMSEIPDLTTVAESEPEFRRQRGSVPVKPKSKPELPPTEVNTRDNRFIAVAFCLLLIILISFFLPK